MSYKTYLLYNGNHHIILTAFNIKVTLKNLKGKDEFIEVMDSSDKISSEYLHYLYNHKHHVGNFFSLNEDDIFHIRLYMEYGYFIDMDDPYKIEFLNDGIIDYNYIFSYGKYKHKLIHSLVDGDGVNYCNWLSSQMRRNDNMYTYHNIDYNSIRYHIIYGEHVFIN